MTTPANQADVFEADFSYWDGNQMCSDRVPVRIDGGLLLKHAPGTDEDGREVGYREYDGRWKNRVTGMEGRLFPMPKGRTRRTE